LGLIGFVEAHIAATTVQDGQGEGEGDDDADDDANDDAD
jgi:hypothetical protein